MTRAHPSVIVIGGGVAGIAASVALAEAGLTVALYEKRPLLGGRASSFFDHETGEALDVCQHGTMRCCTNLADLLTRLGVHQHIRYHDTLEFLDSEGRRSVIRGGALPAPAHTALSFLRFRSLQVRDKLAIARGMIAMLLARPDPAFEQKDVASWFREQGQTERALKRFWEPVLLSACNEELRHISCIHAFKIFVEGFLSHPRGYQFGVPTRPLGTLFTEPAVAYLKARGGCVFLREHIDRIDLRDGQIAGLELVDGTRVEADRYVSALQFDLLLKLLPEAATTGVPYFENLRKFTLSPIVGVHLWFDRPIDCPEALALLDRETHWIFNKTRNFDHPPEENACLSLVISACRTLAALPKEEILARVLADVHAALPATRTARLVRSYVLKERKATFSPAPGVEALRPDQRSPVPNLYVAGEWTCTGWPSTMEGAARSGYLAAERLLEDLGIARAFLAPDLPPGPLVRWIRRARRGAPTEERTSSGRA